MFIIIILDGSLIYPSISSSVNVETLVSTVRPFDVGVADFISYHLRLELDFLSEARNARETAALIASEPILAGKVYVPTVGIFPSPVSPHCCDTLVRIGV